jgi:hypothetical protein
MATLKVQSTACRVVGNFRLNLLEYVLTLTRKHFSMAGKQEEAAQT